MVRWSAGILLYRIVPTAEVLIAHMGGPFWAAKEEAAWSIPKGEFHPDSESALDAARREFDEELGVECPELDYAELGTFTYSSGKRVVVFTADGTGFEPPTDGFGEFELEWPPRSGVSARFPEVDRVEWTAIDAARHRVVKGQRAALDALASRLVRADDSE